VKEIIKEKIMGLKSFSTRLLLGFAFVTMCAVFCGNAKASTAFQVDVYSTHTGSGDGTPFTNLVSTSQVDWEYYTVSGGLGGSNIVYPAMAASGIIDDMNWFPTGSYDDGIGFGAQLTGYVTASTARDYFFATRSDDGSCLYIDGIKVVDNGNDHGDKLIFNYLTLTTGIHKVVVNFYENGAGPSGVTAFVDPGLAPANAPVPIPPAVLMLGSGLLGLFGIRRKITQ
jgi:hypothetical protein